jgi:ABC-type multidrug transport system fused ATPase/permease subunit
MSVRYMWRFLQQEKNFKLSMVLMIIAILLMLSQPHLISLVVKEATSDTSTAISFLQIFITYAIIAFLINVVILSDIILATKITTMLSKRSNDYLFTKISKKSLSFVMQNNSGNIGSKVKDVSEALKRLYLTIFQGLVFEGLLYTGFIAYICYTVPLAGFTVLSCTFIYIFISLKFGKKVKIAQKEFADSKNKLAGFIIDSISNILLMKSFSTVENERRVLKPINRYNYKKARKYGQTKAIYGFLTRVLILTNTLIVIGLCGFLLYKGEITADVFVGCYAAVVMLNVRLRFLVIGIENYFDVTGIIENGLELIMTENKIKDKENAQLLDFKNGNIEFKNVSFKYNKDDILKDFSLTIKNKQTVALVGKSGAGKSTIVNLLQRFYDVNEGSLNLEGVDIRDLVQESLRESISYIPQEPGLFSRSIFENISYGKDNVTKQDVIKAAKLANAHEFIEKLPNGYDEVVGERGFKLSGGQKQRIAIARAILKDAPIVIMDEATSALDSHSEQLIQESSKELLKDKTCIVIAHRLSTIKSADRVIVLEDGKILQDGSHQDLLKQNGAYKDLWNLQQDGFIAE